MNLAYPAVTERIGWALLHFVWQGTLIALLYAALRVALARASARARYAGAAVAMLACAVAFAVTLRLLQEEPSQGLRLEMGIVSQAKIEKAPSPAPSPAAPTFILATRPVELPPVKSMPNLNASSSSTQATSGKPFSWRDVLTQLRDFVSPWLPWVVPAWLAGVLLLGGRVFVGWRGTVRLRREASPIADAGLLDALESLRRRLRLPRSVKLLTSRLADSPLTLGWWRPVILFPAAMLSGTDARTLEFLLAHELAHVRRWDYLVNWLQVLVETLLFFHPVVWWLGRDLRCLREECCDDLAIAATGDRVGYARALVSLEELRATWPSLAPAARGGSLLQRVRRLLPRDTAPGARSRWGAGAALLVAVAVAAGFWQQEARGETGPPAALIKEPPHGVVMDLNGKPAPGAEVWLWHCFTGYTCDSRNAMVEKITADANGQFRFTKSLRFDTLQGSIMGDHFVLLARHGNEATGWDLIAGVDPDGAEHVLKLEAAHPVKFRVARADGTVVPDATVWLSVASRRDEGEQLYIPNPLGWVEAKTDAGGLATLQGVPNSAWDVQATAEGFTNATSHSHTRTELPDAADSVFVAKPIDITLATPSSFSGTVVDDKDRPLPGMSLIVRNHQGGDRHQCHMATDAQGRFKVDGLVALKGGSTQWSIWATDDDWTSVPAVVTLNAGEHRADIRIQAIRGVVLRGIVRDPATHKPVAGASVSIRPREEQDEITTDVFTGADGRFQQRIPEGRFAIGIGDLPAGWCMVGDTAMHYTIYDTAQKQEFILNTQKPLKRFVTVRGQTDPPVAGVTVVAHPTPEDPSDNDPSVKGTGRTHYMMGPANWAKTDAQGRFEAAEWPEETSLTLFIRDAKQKRAGWAIIHTGQGLTMAEPVHMVEAFPVRVLAHDKQGQPLPHLELDISPSLHGESIGSHPRATTDAQGIARLAPVLPGLVYEVRSIKNYRHVHKLTLLQGKPAPGSVPIVEVILDDPEKESYQLQILDPDGKPVRLATLSELTGMPQDGDHPKSAWVYPVRGMEWREEDNTHVLPLEAGLRRRFTVPEELQVWGKLADGTPITASAIVPPDSTEATLHVTGLYGIVMPPTTKLDGIAKDEIAGRVLDADGKPVEGARAAFIDRMVREGGSAITGVDGTFRGKMNVEGDSTKWGAFDVLRVEKDGYATQWIPNGSSGQPFDVRLDSTTRLNGRFTAPDGRPLRDVVAVISTRKGSLRPDHEKEPTTRELSLVRHSADGTYDWPVEPGFHTIELREPGGLCALVSSLYVRPHLSQAIPVEFSRGYDLRIRVTDSQGKPMPDVEICRYDYDEPTCALLGGPAQATQKSNADGWLSWKALPPWKAEFSIHGPLRWKRCDDDLFLLMRHGETLDEELGTDHSDEYHIVELNLTRVHETTVRVQMKEPEAAAK